MFMGKTVFEIAGGGGGVLQGFFKSVFINFKQEKVRAAKDH